MRLNESRTNGVYCSVVIVCGLCLYSLGNNKIGCTGAAAVCAGLAHLPQLQILLYVVCPFVCAGQWCFSCWRMWGNAMCLRLRLRLRCFVCDECSRRLDSNKIGDAGAAAVGAGLVHLPQLQLLEYAVCARLCVHGAVAFACGNARQ